MKSILIAIGTGACSMVSNTVKHQFKSKLEFCLIDTDLNGVVKEDDFKHCLNSCLLADRIVLLSFLGGRSGTNACKRIVNELHKSNLPFSAITILPNLNEGNVNISRALNSISFISDKASSIYAIENIVQTDDNTRTIGKVLKKQEDRIISLIKSAINSPEELSASVSHEIIIDYQKRCEHNASVQYAIAKIYEEGSDVEQDFTKAFSSYEKAANLGHTRALFNLGCLYENGEGTEQDYQKAYSCYEEAASKGNVDATCCLANLFEEGLGTEKNYEKAFYWYKKAADEKVPYGIYKIARMYMNGIGVEKNYPKGIEYLHQAAELGFQLARTALKKERERTDNEIIKKKINFRLALLVSETGLSNRLYATKIGISPSKFGNVINGLEEADIPLLRLIKKAYPDVDLNWLVGIV